MEKTFLVVIYDKQKFIGVVSPGWEISGCYSTDCFSYDIPVAETSTGRGLKSMIVWVKDIEKLFYRKRSIYESL